MFTGLIWLVLLIDSVLIIILKRGVVRKNIEMVCDVLKVRSPLAHTKSKGDFSMNEKEKLDIAFALERLGVDIIEAGFPVISKGDFNSVKTVAKYIKNSTVAGLARSIKKDIDAAADALKGAKKKRIHVFLLSTMS